VSSETVVLVVAASEGYPSTPRTGDVIHGLDAAEDVEGADVLCAGVATDDQGRLLTAGGRVLDLVGRGPDVSTARTRAYDALARISWPGLHHRTDIASST
jgi:phosphoribosylamine--glycine ligase